ncbi:MAG TPA: hypothetical protein VKT33_01065 [Candidatus Angelobacter sp.]|nr:hypothetical protein [Candidatus Angelobacter sp.]
MASDWERQRAKEVAEAVLNGQIGVLEGARALWRFARTDAIASAEDRTFIIVVDSETDHLPIGDARQYWASDALRSKDLEIAAAEAWCKAKFLEICRRIVQQ